MSRFVEKLRHQYSGKARIHIHGVAVSDKSGSATLYSATKKPGKEKERTAWATLGKKGKILGTVETITLSDFVRQNRNIFQTKNIDKFQNYLVQTSKNYNPDLIFFGHTQNIKKDNKVVTKDSFRGAKGQDWDNSERSLFLDLKKNNIFESYRIIYPKRYSDKSWIFKRKEKIFGQRFDHFFASDNLKVEQVKYLKIEKGISDHLPLKVVYRI
mgnify:CR=1 FL=1